MPDEQPKQPIQPAPIQGGVTPKSPTEMEANTSASDKQSEVNKLTAEEQMALFEKDLKENDWGHQPC
jgi:hypothetical protein